MLVQKMSEKTIPWIICPRCKKQGIPVIDHYEHETIKDLNISVVSCVFCENVLNIDEDLEIKTVTKEYAAKFGWKEDSE